MVETSPSADTACVLLSVQQQMISGGLQVLCAIDTVFNHVDQGLPMWTGDGDRKASLTIAFQTPFATPPVITLGLAGIDSAHDQNLRFWLSAHDITTTGFRVEFSTWADTHIARAAVSWHALGPAEPENDVSALTTAG